MSVHALKAGADALLRSFLRASDQAEEDGLLAQLITDYANPVITRTVLGRLQSSVPRAGAGKDDLDELSSEVRSLLLRRLRAIKGGSAGEAIENFEGYVAAAARNACDEYLRRKFPQRRKLKDRIRYCLTSRPGLALWNDAGEGWLSGLAEWEGVRPAAAGAQPLSALLESLSGRLRNVPAQRLELDELLASIFRAVGRPLDLDQLTALVAKLLGVEDGRVSSFDPGAVPAAERVASPQAGHDTLFEQREMLEELWAEIRLLPRPQRVALLCNLKNPQGVNVITLFPATQVATFEQLAGALEISPAEFETLWSRLPLDDLSIAEYLKVTRQQVINLRRGARDRLLRRRKMLEGGTPR